MLVLIFLIISNFLSLPAFAQFASDDNVDIKDEQQARDKQREKNVVI